MSSRSEIREDAISRIGPRLAGSGELGAGWAVRVLDAPSSHAWTYELLLLGVSLTRCWLCNDKVTSELMWRAASRSILDPVRLEPPRCIPWLAGRLLPPVIIEEVAEPRRLLELGDLELCVAWALLEFGLSGHRAA